MKTDSWEPRYDPVHQKADGMWYFWNETWSDEMGGFPTEEVARTRLADYCKYIGGCSSN